METFTCAVCAVTIRGKAAYVNHCRGKAHRRNVITALHDSAPHVDCSWCGGHVPAKEFSHHMFASHIRLSNPVSDVRRANMVIERWNSEHPDRPPHPYLD